MVAQLPYAATNTVRPVYDSSFVRYVVERTFGSLKLHHGLGKARYLGLARNKTRTQLIVMSHNLKTGMNIFKELQRLQENCA